MHKLRIKEKRGWFKKDIMEPEENITLYRGLGLPEKAI